MDPGLIARVVDAAACAVVKAAGVAAVSETKKGFYEV